MMSNALLNIFLLGLAFMILFTAFQTTSIISVVLCRTMQTGMIDLFSKVFWKA